MKRSEAVKRYGEIVRGGITGSFEHVERLFSEASGRGDLWEREEPELPARLGWVPPNEEMHGHVVGVHPGPIYLDPVMRPASDATKREAVARYNAVESFLAWCDRQVGEVNARAQSVASVLRRDLVDERALLEK